MNIKNLTILFTHDIHDHLLSFSTLKKENIVELGGISRLKVAIDEERKNNSNTILVDGGDFSMGTLFQSIFTTEAPAIKLMGDIGYDAITFGNHEYDFMAKGLANTLNSAKVNKDNIPKIVQANVEFPKRKDGKLSESLNYLNKAMNDYGVKEYIVMEKDNVKIGVFGLMGKDAAVDAPMSEVQFIDPIKSAKKIVHVLKEKEKVDIIICLSHAGINKKKSKSEDEILAKKVSDIDIIISGHSHTELKNPIIIGKTIIGACGENGENLGVIKVSMNTNKGWNLESYKLKPIDSTLKEDLSIRANIEEFKDKVEESYLTNFDMSFHQVLAKSPFNFSSLEDTWYQYGENPLGNLISDAYRYAVRKAEGERYNPITAAIVPTGTIRGSFIMGDITVSDVFNVSSLGVGSDKLAGYPLVSAYLTGKELKTVCEVDASLFPIMCTAQLHISGLKYEINPKRIIFRKVKKVRIEKEDGVLEELNNKKLYRVVVGLYSAQMLSYVGKKSFGLLSIVPKTKDGIPITKFEDYIIKDDKDGEIKEWIAIAEYLKSFDKAEGVPQIPEYYNKLQGRKVINK